MTLPETAAGQRIGQLLSTHMPSYWSSAFWDAVGNKCVANRTVLRAWFDELDQDPRRLGAQHPVYEPPPAPHWDRYDPDDVAEDREDDREREARQDESAKPGPRLGQ